MDTHKTITLGADLMFVNKIPVLNIISNNIKFGTTDNVPITKNDTLYTFLLQLFCVYKIRGKTNMQLEPMRAKLDALSIPLNTVATNKHVSDL